MQNTPWHTLINNPTSFVSDSESMYNYLSVHHKPAILICVFIYMFNKLFWFMIFKVKLFVS